RLAAAIANRGCSLHRLDRYSEALADLQEALAMFVQLRREQPETAHYRTRLLCGCANLIQLVAQLAGMGAQVDWSVADGAMARGDAEVAEVPAGAPPSREMREMLSEFHRASGKVHAF